MENVSEVLNRINNRNTTGRALLSSDNTTNTSGDGVIDKLPSDVLTRGFMMMNGCKSSTYDPDTPTYTQAMKGPNGQEFKDAMAVEIAELEAHGTWE